MTIYDLVEAMSNMSYDIVVQNDERIEDLNYKPFRGEVEDFRMSDLYDEIQDEEVTDVFTESDGTMWICYQASMDDAPGFYERYRDPYN